VRPETWEIVEASAAAAELLGLSELKGLVLSGFRRLYKLLQRESGQGAVRAETVLALPDGRTQTVDAQARLVTFDGTHYLWVLLLEPVNERGLTERLVLTDRLALLGQLLVGIAHEIRNPLAAIQLNLHLVRQSLPEDSECASFVQMALAGTERIAELIETTLSFARPTAQLVQLHDIHTILEGALGLLRTMLYNRNIVLQRQYASELPPVYGDARQLQQVFINLLSNAVDAIEGEGTITIQTAQEHAGATRFVVVSIEDTGKGIAPEDLARIFEPFFTRKPHGTGLGLAIARRIVIQHRGELLLHSTPGAGTRCLVRLPAAEERS
jgi:signal transduction histidine kinase